MIDVQAAQTEGFQELHLHSSQFTGETCEAFGACEADEADTILKLNTYRDPRTCGWLESRTKGGPNIQREVCGVLEHCEWGAMLKECLDYCSHAWPSQDVYDSFLSKLSQNPDCGTEPDPTDLSGIVFSDGSDNESTTEMPRKGSQVSQVQPAKHLPSAFKPHLTSKQAKLVHVQHMLHRDLEQKRQKDMESEPADLPSAWECNMQEDNGGILTSAESYEDSWSTHITRKHRREIGLKELKNEEFRFLRSNFGKIMKEVESQKVTSEQYESGREDFLPEVSSIRELNGGECRRLLQQMKPLVHAPLALYKALARRALDDYAKGKPHTFNDCRRMTFWQFGPEKERRRTDCTSSGLP